MPWADEWGAVIGIEEGDERESGDVVHDAAGGVRGVVESVQRAGGHCSGDADCESAGDAVGGADRVLREHAGDAGGIAWGDELPGVVWGGVRVRLDLEFNVMEQAGELHLVWVYKRDLFDRWRMEQMARHYLQVLTAVSRDAEQAVARVELLSVAERRQILEGWNETVQPVREASLAALFEEQTARTPDAVALFFGPESWSYTKLNERANRLAHYLIAQGA